MPWLKSMNKLDINSEGICSIFLNLRADWLTNRQNKQYQGSQIIPRLSNYTFDVKESDVGVGTIVLTTSTIYVTKKKCYPFRGRCDNDVFKLPWSVHALSFGNGASNRLDELKRLPVQLVLLQVRHKVMGERKREINLRTLLLLRLFYFVCFKNVNSNNWRFSLFVRGSVSTWWRSVSKRGNMIFFQHLKKLQVIPEEILLGAM